jgi:dihydrofolate synthase/folylpolyglutamate synthase
MIGTADFPEPSLPFGSPEEMFAFYQRFVNFEDSTRRTIREYRLDRMRRLLDSFGSPERRLRLIHLAGSKGKGSTALFIARGLEALGYQPGLYTSPHVGDFRERISLAGRFFSDESYLRAGNRVAAALPELRFDEREGSELPTTFELLTLTAFLIFAEEGCNWGVIETGIGGRLDATNVITPEAAVITPVELEHTDLLGSTIREIAGEKAGIIKEGVPVFTGRQQQEAAERFRETAELRGSPLRELSRETADLRVTLNPRNTEVRVRWRDAAEDHFRTPMLGEVQGENAALALLVLRALFTPGDEELEGVYTAFAGTRLPGRMEAIAAAPPLICDGAHTVASLRRLLESLQHIYPARRPVVIFGAVLGKDWEGMARVLSEAASAVLISTPGTFKQSDPAALHRICLEAGIAAELRPSPEEALEEARRLAEEEQPILVTGSFYMAAEIRRIVERKEGLPRDEEHRMNARSNSHCEKGNQP